jgi:hypothetical protein
VTFKGHVSENELDNFWNEITILLSTSNIESYGLAIREAILRGKRCVAVTSVGARDAKENFGEAISLAELDASDIANVLNVGITNRSNTVNIDAIKSKQEIMNSEYVKELVNSWR